MTLSFKQRYAADSRVVRKCAACGDLLAPGARVRASLSWEYITEYRMHDGRICYPLDQKAKSRFVCKACAEKIAAMIGVENPLPELFGSKPEEGAGA